MIIFFFGCAGQRLQLFASKTWSPEEDLGCRDLTGADGELNLDKAWIFQFFLRGFYKCVGRKGDNLSEGILADGGEDSMVIFSSFPEDEVPVAGSKVSFIFTHVVIV